MNEKRVEIQMPSGDVLVCEPAGDDFPEMNIFLEDSEGKLIQDLACVGSEYDRNTCEPMKDRFRVLVWADEHDEDYTNYIHIKRA